MRAAQKKEGKCQPASLISRGGDDSVMEEEMRAAQKTEGKCQQASLDSRGGEGCSTEGEMRAAQRTEGKSQSASLESRGGDDVPAKCGEKSVDVIVAQLSVGVDQLSVIV